MKRRIVLLISALVLLLSTITVVATSEKSESMPTVYIFPPEIYGGFAINVNIKDLEASHKLVGVELRLEFDTTMLFHTKVIEGDFMKSFAPHGTYSHFMVENNYVLGFIQILSDPETGNFTEPFPEGSGTFAAFCFGGVGLVGYSTIHLTSRLIGPIGDIPHIDEDGYVRSIWNRADVNSDGKVDILDVSVSAYAFGSRPGQFRWNTNVDLDMNQLINIIDIVLIARSFGKTSEGP